MKNTISILNQEEVLKKLKDWAESMESVQALVLTSSRATSSAAPVDQFSDYDVAVYVNSMTDFKNDNWLNRFGEVLVRWPQKPQTTFDKNWLTRLVMFENRIRIDFQITTNTGIPPSDFDLGYQVLVDKVGFTKDFPDSTRTQHLVGKPTKEEFLTLINDFFWDATYVAKYLWRNDLFYAKFMFDSSLRFDYFEKMVEWYLASQNDWKLTTNVHGRYFTKYLDQQTWEQIKQTFAGADIEENWQAFFKMVQIFTNLAKQISQQLEYEYPLEQEKKMVEYYEESKSLRK